MDIKRPFEVKLVKKSEIHDKYGHFPHRISQFFIEFWRMFTFRQKNLQQINVFMLDMGYYHDAVDDHQMLTKHF